jgi:lipopolysaccharide transport system ATP-binding protein
MSDTVIKIENVSKQYRLGEIGTGTISHDLNRWWARMRGKEDPYLKIGSVNDRTQVNDDPYVCRKIYVAEDPVPRNDTNHRQDIHPG